jgi:plastocyanin
MGAGSYVLVLAALTAGAMVFLLGCSNDSTTAPADCSTTGGGPAGRVRVGNNFFRSDRNGTCNPAVDTVAAGSTVTWTWSGTTSHSVRSQGADTFPSSEVLTGAGQTHEVTLDEPGTYEYDCSVHPSQMTGQVVVQ